MKNIEAAIEQGLLVEGKAVDITLKKGARFNHFSRPEQPSFLVIYDTSSIGEDNHPGDRIVGVYQGKGAVEAKNLSIIRLKTPVVFNEASKTDNQTIAKSQVPYMDVQICFDAIHSYSIMGVPDTQE